MIQKINSKMHFASYDNTYYDVKIFEVDGVIQNIKYQKSQEKKMIFPWERKNLKLYLKD